MGGDPRRGVMVRSEPQAHASAPMPPHPSAVHCTGGGGGGGWSSPHANVQSSRALPLSQPKALMPMSLTSVLICSCRPAALCLWGKGPQSAPASHGRGHAVHCCTVRGGGVDSLVLDAHYPPNCWPKAPLGEGGGLGVGGSGRGNGGVGGGG